MIHVKSNDRESVTQMIFKEQIYELYKSGESEKLSRKYGIPAATIYKWINEIKPIGQMNQIPQNKKIQAMQKRIKELERKMKS